ncbi:MAG: response regulator transcription factor [Acidimicrobiia bacterium]|nr:response regulator transcription factor [Acidimicrobiia bacterium]
MDLRVLVLTDDLDLASLVQGQAENLGCSCNVQSSYDGASGEPDWADAVIVDLAGEGFNDLHRMRVETPRVRILAVADDVAAGDQARQAGAEFVLLEPLVLAELVVALRALQPVTDPPVIDLGTGEASDPVEESDTRWWATR